MLHFQAKSNLVPASVATLCSFFEWEMTIWKEKKRKEKKKKKKKKY